MRMDHLYPENSCVTHLALRRSAASLHTLWAYHACEIASVLKSHSPSPYRQMIMSGCVHPHTFIMLLTQRFAQVFQLQVTSCISSQVKQAQGVAMP
jgi:hypothetical protein